MLTLLLAAFTFVQLNCENLFDCRHDSLKEDTEFLPDGARRWGYKRYWRKVNHVAQALLATTDGDVPALVALCEVENDSVCRDLTQRSLMRAAGYQYVMTQSPDPRGIDVALLYQPVAFRLIASRSLRVSPVRGQHASRDVLYVEGQVISGDTLHIFVVHAPSRYGGSGATRYRRAILSRIGQTIDSLRLVNPNTRVIVAGDFNEPASSPLFDELGDMTDISANAKSLNGAKGTYRYEGDWQLIDHIFLSSAMLPWVEDCLIFDAPFLTEPDKRYGGVKPFRTFFGYRYQSDGTSDHLPLVLRLRF